MNADLYKGSFIVNTAFPTRRLQYDVVIGNADDIQATKRLMLEVPRDLPGVGPEPAPALDFPRDMAQVRERHAAYRGRP